MDTILYFMKKRGLPEPEIEPVGLKTYLLIRIGLDVEKGTWFGRELDQRLAREAKERADRVGADSIGAYGTGMHSAGAGGIGAYRTGMPCAGADSIGAYGTGIHSAGADSIGAGRTGTHRVGADSIRAYSTGAHRAPAQEAFGSGGEDKAAPGGPKGFGHWLWTLCHPIQARHKVLREKEEEKALRERRRKEAKAQEEALAFQERMREETEASMRRIAAQVRELAGEEAECFCVYEDSLRRALIGGALRGERAIRTTGFPETIPAREAAAEAGVIQSGDSVEGNQLQKDAASFEKDCLPILWEKNVPIKEFTGYSQRFWVELLCARAVLPHFVILGTAPCLFDVIKAHAHRMKSLRWALSEAAYDEETTGFVEDFYTEYGLAITVQLFPDMAAPKRLHLNCKEPVNILDFTGEAFTAVWEVPEGSVWLDVFSVEEKKRRLLSRGKEISYVSLKEIWKTAQKRCNCPILP